MFWSIILRKRYKNTNFFFWITINHGVNIVHRKTSSQFSLEILHVRIIEQADKSKTIHPVCPNSCYEYSGNVFLPTYKMNYLWRPVTARNATITHTADQK